MLCRGSIVTSSKQRLGPERDLKLKPYHKSKLVKLARVGATQQRPGRSLITYVIAMATLFSW